MTLRTTLAICTLALLSGRARSEVAQSENEHKASENALAPEAVAVDFVRTYCIDCHAADDPEAGLNLEALTSTVSIVDAIERWSKIADRVGERQMPPEGATVPADESRAAFVNWVRRTIHSAICDDGVTPGPPMLRRLTRDEYANTIRDLLGIHIDAGHDLPADGAGGEGFDNASETLFISPIHAEKYLEAARMALDHALKDPRSRRTFLIAEPSDKLDSVSAARQVLAVFLPRAFRRPVRKDELEEYTHLFEMAYEDDPTYLTAIQFALEASLVSPKFLFLWEEPNDQDTPVLISQYEMASRLSYFLWASMPDQELMTLADEGKLHDDGVLEEQVARMLESEVDRKGRRPGGKVRAFASSFTEQWLGTRALGREFQPDESVAGRYDTELEGGMKYEPVFFFEDLLAENHSLLNLIDANFTYVNIGLARHYGFEGGYDKFREQPTIVELPEDSHRGGLLGMSAVLAVSSLPHRTSPVLRGKWILETLLGTPPPPPPPDVGELDESSNAALPATLRERLELHRADAQCASCHATIDPLGFGLENYDVLGRWRTEIDGFAVDARGELPDGTTFEGPDELKQLLLGRKQRFARSLTTKMLGYAVARGLTNDDDCVVEGIVEALANDDYRSQTLIVEIVKSVPFRCKQGRSSQAAAQVVLDSDASPIAWSGDPTPINAGEHDDER